MKIRLKDLQTIQLVQQFKKALIFILNYQNIFNKKTLPTLSLIDLLNQIHQLKGIFFNQYFLSKITKSFYFIILFKISKIENNQQPNLY